MILLAASQRSQIPEGIAFRCDRPGGGGRQAPAGKFIPLTATPRQRDNRHCGDEPATRVSDSCGRSARAQGAADNWPRCGPPTTMRRSDVSTGQTQENRKWLTLPIDGSSGLGTPFPNQSFAGNVLRYGIGMGYTVHEDDQRRIAPVLEVVGWTLLGGLSSSSPDGTAANLRLQQTDGQTIVNAKLGLRITDTRLGSLYAGYGRGLTDEVWYRDIFRLEYRLMF